MILYADKNNVTVWGNYVSCPLRASGLWLYTNNYWERSPYASNSTNFMNVNNNGNPTNNNTASNTNGVLPGF